MEENKRFKKLPTEEEWAQFCKDVEQSGMKVIKVPKTVWTNEVTMEKQEVFDIPILAPRDSSERPWAIQRIERLDHGKTAEHWIFNDYYAHINMSTGSYGYSFMGSSEFEAYKVHYQEICNPITMHHFYTKDEKELTLLFQGQLMGQNTGSRYQSVESPFNNYLDKAVRAGGLMIKKNAPILQLLTRETIGSLKSKTPAQLKEVLHNLGAIDEDYVFVKYIENDCYCAVRKDEVMEDRLSHYYPVITYEQYKNISDKLPKTDIDFSCFGLGSAGTGILDQVARSTYFEKYFLVDMDFVENKNLRNQWYLSPSVGNAKTLASKNHVLQAGPSSNRIVERFTGKFQDVNLKDYKTKYIVSGFDSLQARQELLDTITDGTFEAQYLIDARYDDLTASVYFVDLSKKDEVDYYAKNLKADMEVFEELQAEKYVKTKDEFLQWITKKGVTEDHCIWFHDNYMGGLFTCCQEVITKECTLGKCWREDYMNDDPEARLVCKSYFERLWEENKDKWIAEKTFKQDWPEESSCVRQNFIDIYKYASSYIFAAIREIETGEEKPFTYIEVQTDKVPTYKIIK